MAEKMAEEAEYQYYEHGEKGAVRFVTGFLDHHGGIHDDFELPPVIKYVKEMSLSKGRADIVAFHDDGSLTVIEVKAEGDIKNILGGIGQLLLYTMQIGMSTGLKGEVRGMLSAPIDIYTDEAQLISKACERAGLMFWALPRIDKLNDDYKFFSSEPTKEDRLFRRAEQFLAQLEKASKFHGCGK